jgi:hypothetical protein
VKAYADVDPAVVDLAVAVSWDQDEESCRHRWMALNLLVVLHQRVAVVVAL